MRALRYANGVPCMSLRQRGRQMITWLLGSERGCEQSSVY